MYIYIYIYIRVCVCVCVCLHSDIDMSGGPAPGAWDSRVPQAVEAESLGAGSTTVDDINPASP